MERISMIMHCSPTPGERSTTFPAVPHDSPGGNSPTSEPSFQVREQTEEGWMAFTNENSDPPAKRSKPVVLSLTGQDRIYFLIIKSLPQFISQKSKC